MQSTGHQTIFIEQNNTFAIADSGWAICNHKQRFALHNIRQPVEKGFFGFQVQGSCRLIEY